MGGCVGVGGEETDRRVDMPVCSSKGAGSQAAVLGLWGRLLRSTAVCQTPELALHRPHARGGGAACPSTGHACPRPWLPLCSNLLHVAAYRRHRLDCLSQVQAVQDGGFARVVQPHCRAAAGRGGGSRVGWVHQCAAGAALRLQRSTERNAAGLPGLVSIPYPLQSCTRCSGTTCAIAARRSCPFGSGGKRQAAPPETTPGGPPRVIVAAFNSSLQRSGLVPRLNW